jgi:phospholipid/cholesterol/gamma-HCH transport system substrate-binding protein
MHLTRRILIQLAVFSVIAAIAMCVMAFGYMKAPAVFFGIGRYTVTVDLPAAGGLYRTANVTYRGTEVGRVTDVHLTDAGGVQAVLSLDSDVRIPSDLDAQVHSASAVGEQYVALLPRTGAAAPLKDGDVIPESRASIPPDINALLDSTSRGLNAIPGEQLKTVIDESYTAFGGLGPDISRIVRGSTSLALDARKNLDPLLTLIDQSQPVLDSQSDTADPIRAWARNLANITGSLRDNNPSVEGVLQNAGGAADEAAALFDRLQPTLPVLLANLVTVNTIAIAYHPSLEQILVLAPIVTADLQTIGVANRNTKQAYKGQYLSFNLNLNLPSTCSTGFLPPQTLRGMAATDSPPPPPGDIYCRVPQDSPLNVRGARNYPCVTKPGKRAPTAKMCESDEVYVPLNDGFNWKGDPNATLTGQSVPQPPPGTPGSTFVPAPLPPAPPDPIAIVDYDPATGTYVAPDGKVYTQSDLANNSGKERTWQNMLVPPGN